MGSLKKPTYDMAYIHLNVLYVLEFTQQQRLLSPFTSTIFLYIYSTNSFCKIKNSKINSLHHSCYKVDNVNIKSGRVSLITIVAVKYKIRGRRFSSITHRTELIQTQLYKP